MRQSLPLGREFHFNKYILEIKIKFLAVLTIVCATVFGTTQADQASTESVAIEILPANNVIYKIPGDLGFENWNFGVILIGVNSLPEINRLEIEYYSGEEQICRIEYSGNSLEAFLQTQKQGEITFHNFHHMLPGALFVDGFRIEIFSRSESLGHKYVKLVKYDQQNQYRLPISGTWFVSSGHDFGVEHRRHLSRGHFAWDFIRVDENGQVANGPNLEDNFSFGQPVLAPAPGMVINLHAGEPDNTPGHYDRNKQANFVEIDHGNGEISRSVHLKDGSIRVAVGDSVVSGQVIAEVGNSGNSDRPHLHFSFHRNDHNGESRLKQIPLPIHFSSYKVNWNQGNNMLVKNGRPRRGQFISQD